MKQLKKCLMLLTLICIGMLTTACGSQSTEEGTEETAVTTETTAMFETALSTTTETTSVTSETTTSDTETTTSDTTTETSTETETTTSETMTETTTEVTTTTETTTETTTTTTTVVETETAPETSPEVEEAVQKFEPGIWWSSNSDGDRYFCFYDGSNSGSFRDQENGVGLSFDYEAEENSDKIVFHIGDVSDNTSVRVNFQDSNTAVLKWENGDTETLKYQGLGNFDTFRFYSNVELCEMAMNNYEARNGSRPADASAKIQSNGKIMIEIYENAGDSSASAWYTVDRFTAKGTDMLGNSIELK